MPGCRDIEPLVAAYVEGATPDADRAKVDAHLAGCPPCRRRAEEEAAAREALRTGACRATASDALRRRCRMTTSPFGRMFCRMMGWLRH